MASCRTSWTTSLATLGLLSVIAGIGVLGFVRQDRPDELRTAHSAGAVPGSISPPTAEAAFGVGEDRLAGFRFEFASLTTALCDAAVDSRSCPESLRLLAADHSELHLVRALHEVREHLGSALESSGARKPANREGLRSLLESACFGPDAPFSTTLALGVMRLAPESTPPGVLRAIIEDPPFGVVELADLARSVLAVAATADDLPFLLADLAGASDDAQAKALRGLASFPEGRKALAHYLLASPNQILPHARLDLQRALARSNLTRDANVVHSLLTAGGSHLLEATTRALAGDEQWADRGQSENVATLGDLLSGADPTGNLYLARRTSIAALGNAGPVGHAELFDLVQGQHLSSDERITAIEILVGDEHYSASALETLVSSIGDMGHPDDVSAALQVVASRVPVGVVASALRVWMDRHPGFALMLLDALRGPNVSPSVAAVLLELEPASGG